MATGCNGRIVGLASLGVAVMVGVSFQALAGSAGAEGSDYVVSADANEEYMVNAAIDGYARLVKRGAGNVVLRTTTTEFAGNVVVEEGALYIETAGSAVLHLNGSLVGGSAGTSDILFRKRGTGLLCLNGDVDLARNVQVDQGLMQMTSAASRVYSQVFILKGAGRSLLGDGHAFMNWIRVGLDSYGVFHQTGGILDVNNDTEIGTSASSIGHWAMSGGEAYMSNSVYVAKSAGSFGSFIQSGGLFKLEGGSLSAGRAGSALFHVSGGTNDTRVTQGGQAQRFFVSDWGGCSDVTVSGEGTLLATETLRFGGGGTLSTNVFNVNDGATVKASRFFKHKSAGTASLITVNADGGALVPTMAYDWTNEGLSNPSCCPDHFVIWKKGLVIDTSESAGSVPASHMPFSFESPSGKGVESIALPAGGDYAAATYFGPARIVFEDETGWGASAYAEYDFDTKQHTKVVITSRGCNYSDNAKAFVESPDCAIRYECTLMLSDNAGLGGELVKRGQHDLYLYATNTTTGGIAVESGALYVGSDGVVPSNTPVRVEYGATLRFPTSAPLVLSSFAGAGSVPGCEITVTKSLRAKCADLFAGKHADIDGDLTFAPGATFTITDPENLAAYKRCKAAVAFSALHVNGEPTLAFEGKPTGSARWTLSRLDDSSFKFGPNIATVIVLR